MIPKNEALTDVSVYGFIKENEAENSVLPNNLDFKSDGGQYAMIPKVINAYVYLCVVL